MHRRSFLLATAATGLAGRVRAATPSPTVLELFTSEGCSSCPPADALLGRLAQQPGIIALAWHVDYWNGLGWHDPYSSPLATQRQSTYAKHLGDEVYTPALVVNGARMVVGSDEPAVQSAIGEVGGFAVPVTLHRDAEAWVAEVGAAGQSVSALAATYDPQHATEIAAGENGGRRLTDYRIVRGATLLGTWDGAARRLALPAVAPGVGLVVLIQSVDLKMLGAVELPPV
jgi:hypothetical protein